MRRHIWQTPLYRWSGSDGPYDVTTFLDTGTRLVDAVRQKVASAIVKEPRGSLERILDLSIQFLLPEDVGLKAVPERSLIRALVQKPEVVWSYLMPYEMRGGFDFGFSPKWPKYWGKGE